MSMRETRNKDVMQSGARNDTALMGHKLGLVFLLLCFLFLFTIISWMCVFFSGFVFFTARGRRRRRRREEKCFDQWTQILCYDILYRTLPYISCHSHEWRRHMRMEGKRSEWSWVRIYIYIHTHTRVYYIRVGLAWWELVMINGHCACEVRVFMCFVFSISQHQSLDYLTE